MTDRERVGLIQNHLRESNGTNEINKNSNAGSNRKKKYMIAGGAFVVIVILAIILAVTLKKKDDDPTPGPPGPTPTPPGPEDYNPYEFDEGSLEVTPNFASGIIKYKTSQKENEKKPNKANLVSQTDYFNQSNLEQLEVNTPKIKLGDGNQIIKEVRWSLFVSDYKTATFRAEDNLNKRFEAPQYLINQKSKNELMRLEMLGISYQKKPFGFIISSTQDNLPLVSTVNKTFYLTDKYMQIDFLLPTQQLFGFGERNHEFQLGPGTWTMWANGQNAAYDDGTGFNQGSGVHPFLLVKARNSQKSNEYFGMFFRNTQGQSPVIRFNDDGTSTLSYITIGGNVEVNFFLKGSAKEIIAQYHNFIGKPALPPFWALGFHQNSKLFKSTSEIIDKVTSMTGLNIPLQSLWFDYEYMLDNTELTLNQEYKQNLNDLMTLLQKLTVKLIPVIGSGFKDIQTTKQVSQANSANALILNSTNKPITGQVYTQSLFMDWVNTESQDIWSKALDSFRKTLKFDGLSLDYNENTVFSQNKNMSEETKCNPQEQFLQDANQNWYTQCPQDQNSTFYLPFIPSKTKNFDFWSLDLNATHPQSNASEYDMHSLNGHMQLRATFMSLTDDSLFGGAFKDKRPFAMSRSTFAGSGQYGGHFYGDNDQTFEGLKMYINSLLNFNMFGIPFSGGSICGMNGNIKQTDEIAELCGAWFEVGAWVPFAYQNIDENSVASDITKLPSGPQTAAINSLIERFKYLRHIYTCLFMSNQNGGSCYDPVYFQFPELEIAEYNSTFIVGDAILIQPQLKLRKDGENQFISFFPPGKWLHLRTLKEELISGNGSYKNVDFSINNAANAWLREGYIIQQQNAQVKNTDELLKSPINLLASLDQNLHAEGYVFLDNDGVSVLKDWDKQYEHYKIVINGGSIFAFNQNEDVKVISSTGVNSITIYGELDNKDVDFACYISKDNRKVTDLNIVKDDDKSLTLQMKDSSKFNFEKMNAIHFGNSQKTINQCTATVNAMTKYQWDGTIAVDGNNFTGKLVSDSKFVQTLTVNFLLLATPKGDTVSVTWNFDDQTLASKTFKFPEEVINMSQYKLSTSEVTLKDYILIDQKDSSVLFSIVNPKNKAVVFKLTGLILDTLFNVIESQAILNKNEPGIIGLGEHVSNSLHLEKGVYSMWSRDVPDPVETGTLPAANLYGTHPFYMGMDTAENWFGVFTRLASAQDWWIDYSVQDTSKTTLIKTMSTGNGFGEMYFIFADNAPELVSTYHQNIVGLPVLTPFWAVGWNQCRWGYRNDSMLRDILEKYNDYKIPLDTLWSDIDYMDNYKDFTYDPKNFAGLPQLISDLHKDNKHYIPIVDAGIAQRPNQNYAAYDEGEKNGYFITYDKDQATFTGQVWPNDAAFPDFSQDGTKTFWQSQLTALQKEIPFDGLWLDMNEASNFCNGVCYQNQRVAKPVKNILPYVPTGRDLEGKSISLDAYHKGNDAIELDMHSLFGTLEVAATSNWFKNNKKRPMIIERSGFAGIGKYGSRWMGDNWSSQEYMGYSLVGVQAHNIFGIPLVGSDICGFIGDTTPELCARWHVVGSFYPFSRNHNGFSQISQEPWVFNEIYEGETTYSEIMIQAIRNKYRIAKYYYTQMYLVSKNGGSFIQPLFFQFPQDANSKSDLQYNMMIGEALKLGINSDKLGQDQTDLIFPQGATWCNLLYSKEELLSCIDGKSIKVSRSSKAYEFDLHLRDGYIVPLQDSSDVMSTHDLLQKPVELHMNLRCIADADKKNDCSAQGTLINDDGVSLISDEQYKSVTFNLKLTSDPFADGEQTQKMSLLAEKDQPSDYDCKNNLVSLIYIHNADKLFKDAIYTVSVAGKEIGKTIIEKVSNRLMLDLSSQPLDLSKLDATGIVFDISK